MVFLFTHLSWKSIISSLIALYSWAGMQATSSAKHIRRAYILSSFRFAGSRGSIVSSVMRAVNRVL